MADPGFIDAGSTTHFSFEFNNALDAPKSRTLCNALVATCERDYNIIASWFDGLTPAGIPFVVQIGPTRTDRGGSNDQKSNITIDLGATDDFPLAREVLVAELIEIFMPAQKEGGWKAGQSHGEGLSQAAGFSLYPEEATGLDGAKVWLGARDISGSFRPNFVGKTDNTDSNKFSYGCALLFIYYLHSQLGFSMRGIVHAAAGTLEDVYTNLTQDHNGFAPFSALVLTKFPLGDASAEKASENPFPLPSPAVLSARRFLARHPRSGQTLRQLIAFKNIGDFRALLNSNRVASLVA
jgi:hypothetical protein